MWAGPWGGHCRRRRISLAQAPHEPCSPSKPSSEIWHPMLPFVVIAVVIGIGAFWWLQNRDGLDVRDQPSERYAAAPPRGRQRAWQRFYGHPPTPASSGESSAGSCTPTLAEAVPTKANWTFPQATFSSFRMGTRTSSMTVLFPDQPRVATASMDGTIAIWDLSTAKRVQTLGPVPGALVKIALSHDGKYLAAGGDNYKAHLLEPR